MDNDKTEWIEFDATAKPESKQKQKPIGYRPYTPPYKYEHKLYDDQDDPILEFVSGCLWVGAVAGAVFILTFIAASLI